jgi:hypothetical protein
MKPASMVCLGLALYEMYNYNFFSALVYTFMANMILTEQRYSAIKERLDAQEYL